MAGWRFLDYITEDGTNLIADWSRAQDPAVQVAFDATVLLLRGVEDWEHPAVQEFRVLTEEHVGLSELRFRIGSGRHQNRPPWRRFRPVGIYAPEVKEFTLILGCEKKMSGRIYIPAGAFDLALEYKAAWENGKGAICEHVF